MRLPAFQNLLAKVETNYYRNRPQEAVKLEAAGTLPALLQERAAQAWAILSQARKSGMEMYQAEELAADLIYPRLESVDRDDECQMDLARKFMKDRSKALRKLASC
jgi:hypothetical protein